MTYTQFGVMVLLGVYVIVPHMAEVKKKDHNSPHTKIPWNEILDHKMCPDSQELKKGNVFSLL
jgi:hypothetical protein